MADVNHVLAANRAAVIDLVAAAERSAATWTTPRAPGEWSPSQVVEHVAGGLEEAANVVSGAPSDPDAPRFPAPAGQTVLQPDIEEGRISEGVEGRQGVYPTSGPATPAQARVRLEGALARFDQECRRRVASGRHLVSTVFGRSGRRLREVLRAARSPPLQTDARRNLKTARLAKASQLTTPGSRRAAPHRSCSIGQRIPAF